MIRRSVIVTASVGPMQWSPPGSEIRTGTAPLSAIAEKPTQVSSAGKMCFIIFAPFFRGLSTFDPALSSETSLRACDRAQVAQGLYIGQRYATLR
jgi:hypothetical protein